MKKQNIRTLSLIVVTLTYLLIGAAVFDNLESEYERMERTKLKNEEKEIIKKYNLTDQDIKNLTTIIIKFAPHRAGTQWKFAGAFFFSTTVITTIGYGYSTPKTLGGKIFCMFYALVGIPLNLIMFQSIGERLNIFVTFLLRQIKKGLRLKSHDVSQTNLIFVCLNMSSIVVAGGAYAFSRIEGWSYIDSFYYCVITLTTIGFGDYVALQRNEDLQKRPQYFIFSLLFILFGLAILSAAMNLLVLRFLTLNTEDERKDELEALASLRSAVRLEGDIITSNNTLYLQQQQQQHQPLLPPSLKPCPPHPISSINSTLPEPSLDLQDSNSVCSCTCYNLKNSDKKPKIPLLSSSRKNRTNSTTTSSFIAQLLQPVRVLQAMTQVHSKKNNVCKLKHNTVFGLRRNSI